MALVGYEWLIVVSIILLLVFYLPRHLPEIGQSIAQFLTQIRQGVGHFSLMRVLVIFIAGTLLIVAILSLAGAGGSATSFGSVMSLLILFLIVAGIVLLRPGAAQQNQPQNP